MGGQILGFTTSVLLTLFIFDGKNIWKTRIGVVIQLTMVIMALYFLLKVK